MATDYPYNGRLSRWEEIADGLAIVGVAGARRARSPSSPASTRRWADGPGGQARPAPDVDLLVGRPASTSTSSSSAWCEGGDFTPLLWERKVGDPINIKGAKGRFLLQDDGRRASSWPAAPGLAPFMSMIDTLRDRGQTRDSDAAARRQPRPRPRLARASWSALEAGGFPLRYAGDHLAAAAQPRLDGLTGRVEAIVDAQLDAHGLDAGEHHHLPVRQPRHDQRGREIAAGAASRPEQVRKELYWPKGREH